MGQTTTNGASTVFKNVDHFELGDVDLDKNWSNHLNFAMQGDDVDMWFKFENHLVRRKEDACREIRMQKTMPPPLLLPWYNSVRRRTNFFSSLVCGFKQPGLMVPALAAICFIALNEKLRKDVITSHFLFDPSSNHKAYGSDALVANRMSRNPYLVQKVNTIQFRHTYF
ncbi:unnamed protein product [Absidia cylindrospora]